MESVRSSLWRRVIRAMLLAATIHGERHRLVAQVAQPMKFGTDDSARVAWLHEHGAKLKGKRVVLWYPRDSLGDTEMRALVNSSTKPFQRSSTPSVDHTLGSALVTARSSTISRPTALSPMPDLEPFSFRLGEHVTVKRRTYTRPCMSYSSPSRLPREHQPWTAFKRHRERTLPRVGSLKGSPMP